MKVLKFGGTSVGSPKRMLEVVDIIDKQDEQIILVLSAMSGTTNSLVQFSKLLIEGENDEAEDLLRKLHSEYQNTCTELFENEAFRNKSLGVVEEVFDLMKSFTKDVFTRSYEKIVLAQGEILSTQLFYLLCQSLGMNTALIDALDFMRLNEKGEPFLERTNSLIKPILTANKNADILITQGYICRNHWEEIDNLQRGGSDYTATIIGAITKATEIQIWTDIDGVHNNDPRVVDDTYPIRKLSYREAAELAYFGAKILHPTCVLPAESMNVPLRLKHTMDPEAPGTLISAEASNRAITSVAAKDNITVVNIYSSRMLMAYGFLKKVFQVFEDHKTSVDMITTSEVAVSLTIDDDKRLKFIQNDLCKFSEIKINKGYSIICIVGNDLYDNTDHMKRIFAALSDIPVRMVSMGGSQYNVSVLIKTEYKNSALKALNSIFELEMVA